MKEMKMELKAKVLRYLVLFIPFDHDHLNHAALEPALPGSTFNLILG